MPLTQKQAERRYQCFNYQEGEKIRYILFLLLREGDVFDGQLTIIFDVSQIKDESDLFLDFNGQSIKSYTVNQHIIDSQNGFKELWNDGFIKIQKDHIKQGLNSITLEFTSMYVNDGYGIHKFIDTDKKAYYVSTMCPYNCNKVFPCFDQPDLKASLELALAYPKGSIPISNEGIDDKITKATLHMKGLTEEEREIFDFAEFTPTPYISTYLFAIICGPFKAWKSPKTHNGIPMAIFCRESLSPYMENESEELFEIVIQGMQFYEQFFKYKFPFSKFDLVFCPELFYGAMENPGAITFNDDTKIFKEEVINEKRTQRAITIVHELSHMWFGNLVTMKWWNDIWLNESFADFISFYCLDNIAKNLKCFKPDDAWHSFFNRKAWGYQEDQLSTTHPVAGELEDTRGVMSIFDGITYSKGASCLKQLLCLVGAQNFSTGIQKHFEKFEWSNATLNDLITSFSSFYAPSFPNCPNSLEDWNEQFFKKAGLNECEPMIIEEGNKIKIKIVQTPARPEHPTLRNHKMKIAFFSNNALAEGKKPQYQDIVLQNTVETIIETDLTTIPQAVLLNYDDEAFIKVKLDTISQKFFGDNLSKIYDPLTRVMIVRSFYDMVRDGQFSSFQFINIIVKHLEFEEDDSNLNMIIDYCDQILGVHSPSILRINYLAPQLYNLAKKMWKQADPANKNRIIMVKKFLISNATYSEMRKIDNVAEIYDWYQSNNVELSNFTLSLENKKMIVKTLLGYTKIFKSLKSDLVKQICDLDATNSKVVFEKECTTRLSTTNELEAAWKKLLDKDSKDSVMVMRSIMSGYIRSPMLDQKKHLEAFFGEIENIYKERGQFYANSFFDLLFPPSNNINAMILRVEEVLKIENIDIQLKTRAMRKLDQLRSIQSSYKACTNDILDLYFEIKI